MRWIWIDKFIELESGRRARAIKNVSLAEEHLHDHFTGYPVMPNSLIIEGLAWTGGILVGEHNRFEKNVILAKIPKAQFHRPALPGDTLIYTAEAEYIKEDGAMVKATSHIGESLQAEMEIVFAHLPTPPEIEGLFDPDQFVFTLDQLRIWEVGRTADGGPLVVPPRMAKR